MNAKIKHKLNRVLLVITPFIFSQISYGTGLIRCEEVIEDLYSCIAMSKLIGVDYHYTLDLTTDFCGLTVTGHQSSSEIQFQEMDCDKVLRRPKILEFVEASRRKHPIQYK